MHFLITKPFLNLCKHYEAWGFPSIISLSSRSFAILATALTTIGCSHFQHQELATHDDKTTQQESPSQVRTIPKETLNELLIAEFAGQRQRYDIALDRYLTEAANTEDANITERALKIAQYINDEPAAQEASLLWIKTAPENPNAINAAAYANLQLHKYKESLQLYTRLYESHGIARFDYYAANLAQEERNNHENTLEKSLTQLQELSEAHPQEANLLYAQAILQQSKQQPEKALKLIDKALKLSPRMLTAAMQKARILVATNQANKAIEWLDEVTQNFPDDKPAAILRARLLLQQKRVKESREAFIDINNRFAGDPQMILSLALLNEELGYLEEAQTSLKQLIGINHYHSPAHYYLGRIAETQNLDLQALQHYQNVGNSKEFLAARFSAANIIQKSQGIDTAIHFLNSSITQYPEQEVKLARLKVDLLLNNQQFESAMEELSLVLTDYPNDADLLYTRAMLAEKLGNLALLEKDLRHMIQHHPANAEAYNALGYSLANHTDRLDEAETLLVKAISLRPESAAITDSLGWLYFRQNKIEKAGALLLEAWQNMKDHEVAAHLGEWYWTTGDENSAKKIWQQGLKLNPESQVIHKTLTRFNIVPSDL